MYCSTLTYNVRGNIIEKNLKTKIIRANGSRNNPRHEKFIFLAQPSP
jgi:hypothetical protein